jgi:hypothetical protein
MTFSHFSPTDQFYIGVDPGQQVDPTAIAVVRRVETYDSLPTFQCGYLERLPLGTPYPGIIWRVRELLANPTFAGRAEVVVDATGVGMPVADMFEASPGIYNLTSVVITAGFDVIPPCPGKKSHSVPKLTLIAAVQALLHDGRLQIAAQLPDAEALKSELLDFRATVNEMGRWTFGARVGKHDDLVLALALAVWRANTNSADFGMWMRLGGVKPPQARAPADLVAGEGVIVTLKERVWLAGPRRWLEAGPQVLRADLAAELATEYLE